MEHLVTCTFTDLLTFTPIAQLPVNELAFSKTLNTPAPWSGSLAIEDAGMRKSAWRQATAPNLSAAWVDIDGHLLYGGRTVARQYHMSQGRADLSGTDFCGYLTHRLQARDYTSYLDPDGHQWSAEGAPALRIAYWILKEALEKAFSIPISVASSGSLPGSEYWITFSAPEAQQQTLASLLSQFQELGYLVGIDYACDVAYVKGRRTATITLSYPSRGNTSPVATIDIGNALEFEYDEDGSEQADVIVEMAGATEDRSSAGIWLPASVAGYPLLEANISHTSLAPTETTSRAILEAYLSGSVSVRAFPLTAPVVTLPLFGSPSIFDIDVGDLVLLRSPKVAGRQPAPNPRFPEGLEVVTRIVRIDCKIPDEGVPTMALTLNPPPALVPVEPPELTQAQKSKEATERAEKEAAERKEAEERRKTEREHQLEAEEKAEEEHLKKAEEEAEAAKTAAEAAEVEAQKAKEEAEAAENHKKEKEAELAERDAEKKKAEAEALELKVKKEAAERKEHKGKHKGKLGRTEQIEHEAIDLHTGATEAKTSAEIAKAPEGGGLVQYQAEVELLKGMKAEENDVISSPLKVGQISSEGYFKVIGLYRTPPGGAPESIGELPTNITIVGFWANLPLLGTGGKTGAGVIVANNGPGEMTPRMALTANTTAIGAQIVFTWAVF